MRRVTLLVLSLLCLSPSLFSIASVSSQSNTWISTTFTIQGKSSDTCYAMERDIHNGLGYAIEGTITVANSAVINFYILNDAQYSNFASAEGRTCGALAPHGAMLSVSALSSYSLNWPIPDNRIYHFIFDNLGSGDVTVTVNLSWVSLSSSSSVQTYSSYSYSYTYQPFSSSSNTKPWPLPSYYTSSTAASSPNVSPSLLSSNWFTSNNYAAYLVFLVAAGVVLIFMIWNHGKLSSTKPSRKVTPKKQAAAQKEAAPAMTEVSGKAFCINCGKELPADWKFCRHCGTKQP